MTHTRLAPGQVGIPLGDGPRAAILMHGHQVEWSGTEDVAVTGRRCRAVHAPEATT